MFEESSAERVVRDFLIPWFVPGLQGRVRTLAAQGVDEVPLRFADLNRMMVFLHLQPIYQRKAWVLVDNDERGREVVAELREAFSGWPQTHFATLDQPAFELFYPAVFRERAGEVLAISRPELRRDAKKNLLLDVLAWLRTVADARSALETSCASVVARLKEIEIALDS